MAQLVTANPKLFSKSTDQELSESVVKVSGNSKFTRLDVREQCTFSCTVGHFNSVSKITSLQFEYQNETKSKNHTELSRRLAIALADTPSAHAYKLVSNTPKIRTFKQEKKRSKDQFAN